METGTYMVVNHAIGRWPN